MNKQQKIKNSNRRTLIKMSIVVVGMFGFGYALIPLYDLFCDITGLNGKTGRANADSIVVADIDQDRLVTIEFTGHTGPGLPWKFKPLQATMRVHPGEIATAKYMVENTSDEVIIGQAIPSVSPSRAAPDFKKIECFCFSQQTLNPGEVKELPVRFVVDKSLAKGVDVITLSYAFFNTDKVSAKKYDEKYNGKVSANIAGDQDRNLDGSAGS